MKFVEISPREQVGSATAGKYDYQKDLSICMLLEHHQNGDDYLFVFDYHDDLAILNSETAPTKYEFFQIKTREGHWTLKSILKRATGKKGTPLNSILGKMFMHVKNFEHLTKSVTLVSNAEFKVQEKGEKAAKPIVSVCLENLESKQTDEILNSIKEEFKPDAVNAEFLKITFLKSNGLSVKESSTHTKGKLSEFLDKRTAGKKYNVEAVYKTIFDEVKRRTSFTGAISDLAQLKAQKGIGRSFFDEILQLVGVRKDYDKSWIDVNRHLTDDGVVYGDMLVYQKHWNTIELDRMNPNNKMLLDTIKELQKIITRMKDDNAFSAKGILQCAQLVLSEFNPSSPLPLDSKYLETLVIVEMHE